MNDFLENLVDDLKPVKKLWTPANRLFLFFPIQLIIVTGLMIMYAPLREGWSYRLHSPFFIIQLILFVISILSFSYYALGSTIPGYFNKRKFWPFLLTFVLLAISLIVNLFIPATEVSMAGMRNHCDLEILILSTVPMIHLIYLLYKGFEPSNKAIVLATMASALFPAGMMHLACMFVPKHILIFHFGPVLLAGIVFSFLIIKLKKKSWN